MLSYGRKRFIIMNAYTSVTKTAVLGIRLDHPESPISISKCIWDTSYNINEWCYILTCMASLIYIKCEQLRSSLFIYEQRGYKKRFDEGWFDVNPVPVNKSFCWQKRIKWEDWRKDDIRNIIKEANIDFFVFFLSFHIHRFSWWWTG